MALFHTGLHAGSPPDHRWNLSRDENPPYGLAPEPGISAQAYEHSRWGVVMSGGSTTELLRLPYTPLTIFADELFLDEGSLDSISPVEYIESVAQRDEPNRQVILNFSDPPRFYALLRKLHFQGHSRKLD